MLKMTRQQFMSCCREEKLKLKIARNKQTKQEESVAEEEPDSDESAEDNHLDLSWLPELDKVYPSGVEGTEDYDRSELSHEGRSSDDDDDDNDDSCREVVEEQNHK